MTQPIVDGWMKSMHDSLKPEDRVKPAGLQTLPAFIVRSHVGEGSIEPSPSTDLFPSWYKQPGRANGSSQNVDIVSNKLATECTPQRAIKVVNSADSNTFSVDKFVNGGGASATTTDKDDIHKCDDVKPSVSISKNGDGSVTAVAQAGTHPLSSAQFSGTINFLIDGQIVNSASISDGSPTATYSPDSSVQDKDVIAQVIDSVLYEKTSGSVHIDGGVNVPALKITDPSEGQDINAAAYVVKWTGGNGIYSVILDGGAVAGCQNTAALSCLIAVPGANNSTHSVTVNTSNESKTVNFKK
jgi:hypothetical protein